MSLRYLTVDDFGQLYEVYDLLDKFTKPTADPALAEWVMVKGPYGPSEHNTDDIPVYTVH